MPKMVFVCTGNTCRSPMAKGLFESLLAKMHASAVEKWEVLTAGTWALPGEPATRHAAQAMGEKGIDLGLHRSRTLTDELIRDADYIVTMTRQHREQVLIRYPELSGKVMTLHEFAGGSPADVNDPFGMDLPAYRTCRDEIETLLRNALERRLAQNGNEIETD